MSLVVTVPTDTAFLVLFAEFDKCSFSRLSFNLFFYVVYEIYLEDFMRKRIKLSRRKSRKMFTNGAKRVHVKNATNVPMRGGIRL